jgi:hypothetical protein
VPKAVTSKRNSSTNTFSTNNDYSVGMKASKKLRTGYDEESIASEQAQKIGATNVMMM